MRVYDAEVNIQTKYQGLWSLNPSILLTNVAEESIVRKVILLHVRECYYLTTAFQDLCNDC